MKKILLLGGSGQQISAIETAKSLGYYTVLCDYLPDNPGQYHADKYYTVSTTDREAILKVAQKENISGILAYASDPAVPTAAYVAEKLGLPGQPCKSVDILCNKDLFRTFLKENHFSTPEARGYSSVETAIAEMESGIFRFPVLVKPVDSSGSKGVRRLDSVEHARNAIENALVYSRSKRFIIEEYVEKWGYQVAGDGLSLDGKLVFHHFGNDHFDANGVNPFVPIAASFPLNMSPKIQQKIHDEIQRLITLLHLGSCTYNFDIRVDKDENVYLMEIAPRDGGNYIPEVIKYATGVDLVEYSVKLAMGDPVEVPVYNPKGYWSYYAVHSIRSGILEKIEIPEEIRLEHIVAEKNIQKVGRPVKAFTGANTSLGCYLMKFDDMDQMLHMMDCSERWISVSVKD